MAALFLARRREFVRLAWLMTSDAQRAEEIVQEAFIRAWQNWGRMHSQQAAIAYVRRTVVNLARMTLRRRMLELRHQWGSNASTVAEHRDPGGRLDMERALAQLPQRRRACVVLRYYVDLSEMETAEILGISVGTVKSQTARALRQLQQHLSVILEAPSSQDGGDHG